ncbi:hypothetical protein [Microtetraspora malaysiensis]|uniref:hypothetical protein n=1 Tax=Microtetraspora malaysiensis TaxID=161358 RepID=UPI003D92F7A6
MMLRSLALISADLISKADSWAWSNTAPTVMVVREAAMLCSGLIFSGNGRDLGQEQPASDRDRPPVDRP